MLISPATSSSSSLPSSAGGFWNKFHRGGPPTKKEPDLRQHAAQMSLARQRLLTLCFSGMETVRLLPNSYDELEAVARDWTKPPPDAIFTLRIPVEFASLQASRLVTGPYVYLTGEDSFQIATMGVQGLRVEIVSDVAPPQEEPPSPPPPPVLEMPGTFNLELQPGQHVALDTIIASEDQLDMSRMDDGTMVDGQFWGRLDIVHDGEIHKLEFSGTRVPSSIEGGMLGMPFSPEMLNDAKALTRVTHSAAGRQPVAKCHLSILPTTQQYCDVFLSFSPHWQVGVTWPPAEPVLDAENKIKYFLRVYPGGALEHFETMMVATSIYYEALPDPGMINPDEFVSPKNSFAMSLMDFLPHLANVLDQLGLSMQARTTFITYNMSAFSQHKNIAYRFLSPRRIAAAIDISVTAESCVFTRLFLIFRGLSDDEMGPFINAGEKEANGMNWREVVGWTENSKDSSQFRVLETSVLEIP